MALLDFLKRKKQAEKAAEGQKSEKKSVKKTEKISAEAKKSDKTSRQPDKNFSYEAIRQPHISEKASVLAEANQYVFEILPGYNKKEIKNAVEGIYNVDVLSVNMIKISGKKRRLGRIEGFRKGYKKAVVKIKEGQKIEIL